MNKLYYGDNLEILREHIADESVDLIYLDPPFKSGQNYNVIFKEQNGSKSAAQIQAFEDTWHWDRKALDTYQEILERAPAKTIDIIVALEKFLGHNDMLAYLVMMIIRLLELHRVLKPTGSIYLHCDPTASHYLKLLLDAVFGHKNFRNEIVWCYYGASSPGQRQFPRKHDIVLWYSKSDKWIFNAEDVRIPYADSTLKRIGTTPTSIFHGKRTKRTAHKKGKIIEDHWFMPPIVSTARERLGYPTQKPEGLLERIVKASSNEGGIVLDPFCGCGTTITVAEKLKREWIGIDITYLAIALIKYRLEDTFDYPIKYQEEGAPKDVASAKYLAEKSRSQFESWALGLVKAKPTQKTADRGIDGNIYFQDDPKGGPPKQIIVSVKSGTVNPSDIRDLHGTVDRDKAAIGVLITLEEPTPGMKKAALDAGYYVSPYSKKYQKIQILTIKELFKGAKIERPTERVHAEDVTFKKPRKHKREVIEQSDAFDETQPK